MKSERPGSSRRLKVEIPEGLTVEQSIDIIYEYQKQCEREGNYIDAEAAKRKLLQLRGELQRLTREDFIASHQAKKEELERAFKEEVKNFNAEWDSIQRQYEQDIVRAEAELIERHKEEVAAEEQLLLQSLPSKPKESPELINLRKIEENLAKH
jgi:acyl-CoA reductase-like NAD-dependent aldehyde dehydrogenase